MSLTFKEFRKAVQRYEEMDERLKRLFGFNPSNGDHYGRIHLYNNVIHADTTDEEILELRAKFVRWREQVLAVFRQKNPEFTNEQVGALFSCDNMCGILKFLGTPLDLDGDIDFYRGIVENYIETGRIQNEQAES